MVFVDFVRLIFSIFITSLAGIIGALFTMPAIPTWYAGLNKPPFTPPNSVFAPVWITLYVLMGIALFTVWREGTDDDEVRIALFLFAVQLVLNVLWSFVFFGLKSIPGGMAAIVILWFMLLLTINSFFQVSELAGWLLVPYIAWVSFAAILNIGLLVLN